MKGLVTRAWFWGVVVAVLAALPLIQMLRVHAPERLPVLGQIAPFALIDESGAPFESKDKLTGRVWAINFISSRCPVECPANLKHTARIRHRSRNLGTAFHLITATIDPAQDRPERLASVARSLRASPGMWSFLTGDPATLSALERTALDGKKPHGAAGHLPDMLVLVDQRMQIRGRYPLVDKASEDLFMSAVGLLVNRGD